MNSIGGKPKRYTAKEMIRAIELNKGMVYRAADMLKCSPQTVYNYARDYPTVQAAIDNARGLFLDDTELKLADAVDNGEGWAIAFTLKTLGKHRGYVEKQQVEQVNLEVDWNKLSDQQISRLASGESILDVMKD